MYTLKEMIEKIQAQLNKELEEGTISIFGDRANQVPESTGYDMPLNSGSIIIEFGRASRRDSRNEYFHPNISFY